MAKISLQEILDSKMSLKCAIRASNSLISEMEVVGYVNSCQDEELIAVHTLFNSANQLRGIIDHASHTQIVCSNHLYQVLPVSNGKDTQYQGILSPIYRELVFADKELDINIETLHIPSLRGNHLYQKIKARIGNGVVVDDRVLRKADFPQNISAVDGKAVLHILPGDLLCIDKYKEIKSVGRNILALCRYVHHATGIVNYAQFELTDVYTEDNENIL